MTDEAPSVASAEVAEPADLAVGAAPAAHGVRIGWSQLPTALRAAVEEILGSPVVTARSQRGGFSPGTADRVVTTDGGRAFVKATSAQLNPHSPDIHRREQRIAAALPASVPAAAWLGGYDDGDWVALVLADVEGRMPESPWRQDDLAAAITAVTAVGATEVPAGLDLPAAAQEYQRLFRGWSQLARWPWPELDPWARDRLSELTAWADRGIAAAVGDRLVHNDIRADNLLVDPAGRMWIVDWPWACRGASWLDLVALAVNVRTLGGPPGSAAGLDRAIAAAGGTDDAVTGVVAGLTGYFLSNGRRPDPPGLPTLRAFQLAQGAACLAWLKQRLG